MIPEARNRARPPVRKVDRIRLRVPDLAAGLAFYRDGLRYGLVFSS